MRLFSQPTRRPSEKAALLFAIGAACAAHIALFVTLWISVMRS